MSGWYLDGKQQLLARTIPAEANLYVVGVNDEYTFDANHSDFAVFESNIILPEAQLLNTTFTGGTLDADDLQWLAAGAGVSDRSLQLQGVIIYFMLDGAGALLAFIDSAQAGLPQTLTGVNVTARWNASGILRI